jgi:hypothetical protein
MTVMKKAIGPLVAAFVLMSCGSTPIATSVDGAAAGATGAAGTTGAAGSSGTAGTTGAAGDTSAAGATGAAGDTGAAGTTGAAGAAGATGVGGTTGAAGAGGKGGATGAAGAGGKGGATGTAGAGGKGGATGTAGAGGATGTAGKTGTDGGAADAGETCAQIEADYAAALAAAQKCNLALNRLTCQLQASTGLRCPGCTVWVDDDRELKAIAAKWDAAGCAAMGVKICPLIACVAPGKAMCVADSAGSIMGTCKRVVATPVPAAP